MRICCRVIAGLRDRELIREAFGTYVDREVAEHILREGTDLAGEEVEVTMMFIDIRGFTGLSERATAPNPVSSTLQVTLPERPASRVTVLRVAYPTRLVRRRSRRASVHGLQPRRSGHRPRWVPPCRKGLIGAT